MVLISERLSMVIRGHGRESYQDEACGVMYGKTQNGTKEVLALEPLTNSRDGERHHNTQRSLQL